MDRIYQNGMTTTSGGNLSVLEGNGDIWITPSGVDKGALTRGDMCRVAPDGTVYGPHKPSVELPFHKEAYKRRPDFRAVLHAHPPALVAFSLARILPDTRLVAGGYKTLGEITMAPYAIPGSEELGEGIASEFQKGFDIVVLENHGVCIGASTMFDAFMKFETLEAAANLELYARRLGKPEGVPDCEMGVTTTRGHLDMEDFTPVSHSSEECAARRDMAALIRRSYRQKLFVSTQGTYSVRLSDGGFIITPYGADRAYLDERDLVLIKDGKKEAGKTPSRSVTLHEKIYAKHPGINSILAANPPYAMAFAVTGAELDTRTIPESYIMLRQVRKIPFSALYTEQDEIASMFSPQTPVLICQNNQILVTGSSLLNAFDRLEVAEATARSVIAAEGLGGIVNISEKEVRDLDRAFN
jgi:L-fuculose-phosphate aldolase